MCFSKFEKQIETIVTNMSLKKCLFLGHVMQRSANTANHIKVRVVNMKLDTYILMYFNKRKDYWAIDPEETCNIGDFVLIEELGERVSPRTRFEVKETVFKLGAVVDPITGKKCRGKEFIEENRKTGLAKATP